MSVGKSCIRFKKLADLNQSAIKKALKEAQRVGGQSRAWPFAGTPSAGLCAGH